MVIFAIWLWPLTTHWDRDQLQALDDLNDDTMIVSKIKIQLAAVRGDQSNLTLEPTHCVLNTDWLCFDNDNDNEKYLLPKLYKGIHTRLWHNINDNIRRQARWYDNFGKGGTKWKLRRPKFKLATNLYVFSSKQGAQCKAEVTTKKTRMSYILHFVEIAGL